MGVNNKISIVVSVYNEEESLPLFYEELNKVLLDADLESEIIFVSDESEDGSLGFIQTLVEMDHRLRVVNFYRNFGHEAAMLAGVDYCMGDLAIFMNADSQHTPSYIPILISKWKEGNYVVNIIRKECEDGEFMRKVTLDIFYKLINKMLNPKLELNASDFFMLSRRVIDILKKQYRERTLFIRGVIQTIGFRRTAVEFMASKRVAGTSKYSLIKLFTFSLSAVSTSSKVSLKIILWLGLASGFLSLIVFDLFFGYVDRRRTYFGDIRSYSCHKFYV